MINAFQFSKSLRWLFLIGLFVQSLSVQASHLFAIDTSFSGFTDTTYIIGTSDSADFASFGEVTDALALYGMQGPLTFYVEDGTYTEDVTIPEVEGNSLQNLLKFKSQSAIPGGVTISGSSTESESIVWFVEADYTSVNLLSFSTDALNGVAIGIGTVNYLMLHENIVALGATGFFTRSFETDSAQIIISENQVQGGKTAVQLGVYGQTDSIQVLVEDNTFVNQSSCGVCLASTNSEINRNTFTTDIPQYYFGVSVYGDFDELNLLNNSFDVTGDGAGCLINPYNDSLIKIEVINNEMVFREPTENTGGFSISVKGETKVFHNTIRVLKDSTDSFLNPALYMINPSGYVCEVNNNILYAPHSGAVFLNGSYRGDNNVFFGKEKNSFYLQGTTSPDISGDSALAYWQQLTGQEANSIFADPQFVDSTSFIPTNAAIDNVGMPLAYVTTDITGTTRSTTSPDAGAYEFVIDDIFAGFTDTTYIIGTSDSADFASFGEVTDALALYGMQGPLTFYVEDGTYYGPIIVPEINGNSAENLLSFEGMSADPGAVQILDSVSTYVVRVDVNHSRWSFVSISGNQGLFGLTSANEFELKQSRLIIDGSIGTGVQSVANETRKLVLEDNYVEGGSSGFYVVRENLDEIHFGSFEARNNILVDQVNYPIYSDVTTNLISGNKIVTQFGSNHFQGITLFGYAVETIVDGNELSLPTGGIGMYYVPDSVSDSARTVLINNTIQGRSIGGKNYVYGFAIDVPAMDSCFVINNTIKLNQDTLGYKRAGLLLYNNDGGQIHVYNNLISISEGEAISVLGGYVGDNNVVYSTVGNPFQLNFQKLESISGDSALAYWQQLTGQETNSIFADPQFDLQDIFLPTNPEVDNLGTPLAYVTTDINGVLRDVATPDVGAREFTVEDSFPGFNDTTYIIGSSDAADFYSFNAAIEALEEHGMQGPITFYVEDGTYTGNFILPKIEGNSATNYLRFEGLSGDSTAVVIQGVKLDSGTVAIIEVFADYTSWSAMSILPDSTQGNFFALRYVDSFSVDHMHLINPYTSFFYFKYNDDVVLSFKNNYFEGGASGIILNDANKYIQTPVVVEGNVFIGHIWGVSLLYATGVVRNNFFSSDIGNDFYAIELRDQAHSFIIENNTINLEKGGVGIFSLNNTDSSGVIANNQIFGGPDEGKSAIGIAVSSSSISVIHNSIDLVAKSENAGIWGFYTYGTSFQSEFYNNIVSVNIGQVVYIGAGTYNGDNNVYYKPSGYFFGKRYYNNPNVSGEDAMVDWQQFTGQEVNSIFADPQFDPQDIFLPTNPEVDNLGTPLAYVTTDINGVLRDVATPDVGAREFTIEVGPDPYVLGLPFDTCWTTDIENVATGAMGTVAGGTLRAAGYAGQGLYFDGQNDRVSMGIDGNLSFDSAFTLAMWVHTEQSASYAHLIGRNPEGSTHSYMLSLNNGVPTVFLGGLPNAGPYAANTAVNDSAWHHIAVTFAQGELSFYIDGVLNRTITSAQLNGSLAPNPSGEVTLGIRNDFPTKYRYRGWLDEVQGYRETLDAASIAALAGQSYNPTSCGTPTGLLAGYWQFEECSSTALTETINGSSEGHRFNGTEVSTGYTGAGLYFDGQNDYVVLNDTLTDYPDSLTVSFWINPSDVTSRFQTIAAQASSPLGPIVQLDQGRPGIFLGVLTNPGPYFVSSTLPQGQWSHVTITYQTGELVIYVNGAAQRTVSNLSGTLNLTQDGFWLGNRADVPNTYAYNGYLDEWRTFTVALPAAGAMEEYTRVAFSPSNCVPNPVSAWAFDSCASAVAIDSYGNHDGTINGATRSMGYTAQGMSFDGANDYVNAGAATDFDFTNAFTIAYWINPSRQAQYETILTKNPAGGSLGYYAQLQQGRPAFFLGGSIGRGMVSGTTLPLNTWSHVAYTWKHRQLTLYIDGVATDSILVTQGQLPTTAGGELWLGMRNDFSNRYQFAGSLDVVQLYSVALQAEAIAGLAGASNTGADCGVARGIAETTDSPFAEAPSLSVFPNPNAGQFTVQWSERPAEEVSIRVVNALGQEAYFYEGLISTADYAIALNRPKAGLYYLQVRTGQDVTVKTMVVE